MSKLHGRATLATVRIPRRVLAPSYFCCLRNWWVCRGFAWWTAVGASWVPRALGGFGEVSPGEERWAPRGRSVRWVGLPRRWAPRGCHMPYAT
eukprot:7420390-Pyramimonas_sp.AAC.1